MLKNMLKDALAQLKVEFPSAYDFMNFKKDFRNSIWDMRYLQYKNYRKDCLELYDALDKYEMAEYKRVCETALGFLYTDGLMIPGIIIGLKDLNKGLKEFVGSIINTTNEEELINEICKMEKTIWLVYKEPANCIEIKTLKDSSKSTQDRNKLIEENKKKYEDLVEYRSNLVSMKDKFNWGRDGKCLLSMLDLCLEDLKILLDRIDTAMEELEETLILMNKVSRISFVIKGYLNAIE